LPEHKRHPKITVLSIADMLAKAITRIHTGDSIGELISTLEEAGSTETNGVPA
jgi:phosphoribosylpyrophosphate synthetase